MWGLPQKQNARRADKIRLCGHLGRYKKLVNLEEKKKSRKVLRLSVKNILNDLYKERVIYNHW